MTDLKQYCPICQREINHSSRYPAYICAECCDLATDRTGRRLHFYNAVETTTEYRNGQAVTVVRETGIRGK